MRKLYLAMVFCALNLITSAQQKESVLFTQKPVYDSIIWWYISSDGLNTPVYKYINQYDANLNLLYFSYNEWEWDNAKWRPEEENYYTYDANDNCTRDYSRFFAGTQWYDYHLKTWEYDNDNHELCYTKMVSEGYPWHNDSRIFSTWEDGNLVTVAEQQGEELLWKDYSRTSHTYDNNDNIVYTSISYLIGDDWLEYNRFFYIYNDQNLLVLDSNIYKNNDLEWTRAFKNVHYYDNSRRLILDSSYYWHNDILTYSTEEFKCIYNDIDNTMIKFDKYGKKHTFRYDANNQLVCKLTEGYKPWNGETWKVDSLYRCFDSKGRLTHTEYYERPHGYYDLETDSTLEYYPNDWISRIVRSHRSDINVYYKDSVIYYLYTPVGLEENTSVKDVMIYPNPANNVFALTANELMRDVIIYDMNGKAVYEDRRLVGTKTTIDVTDFHKGIYMVKVLIDNKPVTLKLVVI